MNRIDNYREGTVNNPTASHLQHRADAPERLSVAILTISDTRILETDESGLLIRDLLLANGHQVAHQVIVKDDPERIQDQLLTWAHDPAIDAIITNGGTGIAARDTTNAALSGVLTTVLDGFGELFRMLSYEEIGAAAMLSRATAGAIGACAVFSLPGSRNAVRLGMERLILPEIAHVVYELRK